MRSWHLFKHRRPSNFPPSRNCGSGSPSGAGCDSRHTGTSSGRSNAPSAGPSCRSRSRTASARTRRSRTPVPRRPEPRRRPSIWRFRSHTSGTPARSGPPGRGAADRAGRARGGRRRGRVAGRPAGGERVADRAARRRCDSGGRRGGRVPGPGGNSGRRSATHRRARTGAGCDVCDTASGVTARDPGRETRRRSRRSARSSDAPGDGPGSSDQASPRARSSRLPARWTTRSLVTATPPRRPRPARRKTTRRIQRRATPPLPPSPEHGRSGSSRLPPRRHRRRAWRTVTALGQRRTVTGSQDAPEGLRRPAPHARQRADHRSSRIGCARPAAARWQDREEDRCQEDDHHPQADGQEDRRCRGGPDPGRRRDRRPRPR